MTEESATGAPDGVSGPDKGISDDGVQPRAKWASKTESLLSTTGVLVGLVNVWRFPYLCFKNGGVVFFIPYFVCLLFCGFPMFFLETALGQYTSESGGTAWRKICPMFHGVGIATQVFLTYINIYSIVIMAWAFYYFFQAFVTPLPWTNCENSWNTELCHSRASVYANPHLFQPDANWSFLNNFTISPDHYDNPNSFLYYANNGTSSELEFWNRRVLRVSNSMALVNVNWGLALCLLLAWIICYLCIFKGIKASGKVVYFTATVPYLLLFILFIRGVSLPGAGDGLRFFLMPDLSHIVAPWAWNDAMMEVIYTVSLGQGVMPTLASYNKYNNNCYRDCIALCCLNLATSIFAGFAVFSLLGFLARDMDLPIYELAAAGPSLIFLSLSKAVALLPGSSFWALLLFFMVLLLGLDDQFIRVDCLATAITDMFPRQLRRRWGREHLVLGICIVCFLLALPMLTEGGIVLFTLMDMSVGEISILFIALFETIIIGWVYGADRFCDNIEDMIGYRPNPVLKYCWLFITPLFCGLALLFNLGVNRVVEINGYTTGPLAPLFSSFLILIALMCIPVFIFITLCKNSENMTTPSSDLRQARPHKPVLTLCKRTIRKSQQKANRSLAEGDEKMMMDRV